MFPLLVCQLGQGGGGEVQRQGGRDAQDLSGHVDVLVTSTAVHDVTFYWLGDLKKDLISYD